MTPEENNARRRAARLLSDAAELIADAADAYDAANMHTVATRVGWCERKVRLLAAGTWDDTNDPEIMSTERVKVSADLHKGNWAPRVQATLPIN